MKKTWLVSPALRSLTLLLFVGMAIPVFALDFTIHFGAPPPPPPPPPPAVVVAEPVYVDFYADTELHLCSVYFGIEYPVVYAYYRDYGLTPDEVVYVFYLSHYCHRPPVYVIDIYKRHRGHGWGVMAKELGLPPGAPSWMKDRNAPNVAVLHATSAYYGIPYNRVYEIHQRGYKPGEIVAAVNVSSK